MTTGGQASSEVTQTRVAALVADLQRIAVELGGARLECLGVADASRTHDLLRAVCDQLRAVDARLLALVEADGRWAASGGARTFPEWVARRGGSSVGTARREVALGKALTNDLPATREAVTAGRMSLEHAQVLTQFGPTSDARRAALAGDRPDRNEAHLVATAQRTGVDDFRKAVRRWAAAVDTQAHEAEYATAVDREYLFLARVPDGVQIKGFLAAEHAETLSTALCAVAGVPAADDPRPPEQRHAAALTSLARLVLDRGLGGAGGALVRPHLSVHVPWDTVERLHALATDTAAGTAPHDVALNRPDGTLGTAPELDDGTPIPLSVLAQLACDAEITRIVFGPDGEPLDVGRAQRTFTGSQRRGVVARDRSCQYPGCGAPPMICEVHHVRWWVRDLGPTAVGNGVLLCAFHHRVVHQRNIGITRISGSWVLREADGRLISAPGLAPPGGAPPGSSAPGEPPGDGGAPAFGGALSSAGAPPSADAPTQAPAQAAHEQLLLAV